jgi:hypothetical protein
MDNTSSDMAYNKGKNVAGFGMGDTARGDDAALNTRAFAAISTANTAPWARGANLTGYITPPPLTDMSASIQGATMFSNTGATGTATFNPDSIPSYEAPKGTASLSVDGSSTGAGAGGGSCGNSGAGSNNGSGEVVSQLSKGFSEVVAKLDELKKSDALSSIPA